MQRSGSFRDVAAAIRQQAARLRVAPYEAARVTAPLLAASVQNVFGHTPPLASLADATQAERIAADYPANDPLVRTGDLRESWVPGVGEGPNGPIAAVGVADPVAVDHELGYVNARTGKEVPPRAAGWEGFSLAVPEARGIWKSTIRKALEGD